MTTAPPAPSADDRLHFDDIGTIVTAAAAATFVASVAFELAFAELIGLHLSDIPITLADFTKNALTWLPASVLGFAVQLPFRFIGSRLDAQRKPRAPLPTPTGCAIPIVWAIDNGPYLLMPVLLLNIFVLTGEEAAVVGGFAFFLLWVWLAGWVLGHPKVYFSMNARRRGLMFYGPALAAAVLSYGWTSGIASLTAQHHATATIRLNEPTAAHLRVLRLYENGALVLDGSQAKFVQWNRVESLSENVRTDIWRGVHCSNFRCQRNAPLVADRPRG